MVETVLPHKQQIRSVYFPLRATTLLSDRSYQYVFLVSKDLQNVVIIVDLPVVAIFMPYESVSIYFKLRQSVLILGNI